MYSTFKLWHVICASHYWSWRARWPRSVFQMYWLVVIMLPVLKCRINSVHGKFFYFYLCNVTYIIVITYAHAQRFAMNRLIPQLYCYIRYDNFYTIALFTCGRATQTGVLLMTLTERWTIHQLSKLYGHNNHSSKDNCELSDNTDVSEHARILKVTFNFKKHFPLSNCIAK